MLGEGSSVLGSPHLALQGKRLLKVLLAEEAQQLLLCASASLKRLEVSLLGQSLPRLAHSACIHGSPEVHFFRHKHLPMQIQVEFTRVLLGELFVAITTRQILMHCCPTLSFFHLKGGCG